MGRVSYVWFVLLLVIAIVAAVYDVRYRGRGLIHALLEVGLLTALPLFLWIVFFPGWPSRRSASSPAPAQDARIIRVFRRRRIVYLLLAFFLVLGMTVLIYLPSRMFPYGVFGAEGTIGGVPISSFFSGPAFGIFLGLLAVLLVVAFVFFSFYWRCPACGGSLWMLDVAPGLLYPFWTCPVCHRWSLLQTLGFWFDPCCCVRCGTALR